MSRLRTFSMEALFYHLCIYAVMFIIVVIIAATCSGDQLLEQPSGCFQEVVVKHDDVVRAFRREGTKYYREWREIPATQWAVTKACYGYAEEAIDQEEVRRVMTPRVYDLFAKNNKVVVSGYYNLSGDWRYDWEQFGGDRVGTTTKQ